MRILFWVLLVWAALLLLVTYSQFCVTYPETPALEETHPAPWLPPELFFDPLFVKN